MGNKGKFILLMVLALVLAGVSLLLVRIIIVRNVNQAQALARQQERAVAEKEFAEKAKTLGEGNMVDVLVARQDIPASSIISPEMVETKKIPQTVLPPQSLTKFEEVNDLIATQLIPTGDILMAPKLHARNEIGRAAFLVKKGKRYISMGIDPEEQGVAGMLRIGDSIDILATCADPEDKNGLAVSKIIIQNARVIDVALGETSAALPNKEGGDKKAEGENKRLGIGNTITFEVTPQDAELFKALEASGFKYKFILRNYLDEEIVPTNGKTTEDVVAAILPIAPKKAPVAAPPPPRPRMF